MNTNTDAAFLGQRSYKIPATMKAWVLGDPEQLTLVDKPVPQPGAAEVLVRIDAIAVCATDLEIIHKGPPALIHGGLPFNKNFTPGHEYMGTVVKLGQGVDEYKVGDRVTVEVHAGCGRCERCREGMYTSCLNYGKNYGDVNKGHRANGFTTDGGFTQYAINNINTLAHVPDDMSDEEATLIVTAGTAMYGLDVIGGLIAGQSVVIMGPGPIGLMGVGVAKALGASEVILTGTRDNRLEMGRKLGADYTINVTKEDASLKCASIPTVVRITYWSALVPPTLSTTPHPCYVAAVVSVWQHSLAHQCLSISPLWFATTSICSVFVAKVRALRTVQPH